MVFHSRTWKSPMLLWIKLMVCLMRPCLIVLYILVSFAFAASFTPSLISVLKPLPTKLFLSHSLLLTQGVPSVFVFSYKNITHSSKTKWQSSWSTQSFLFHLLINLGSIIKGTLVFKLKLLLQSRCSLVLSPPPSPSQGRTEWTGGLKQRIFHGGCSEVFSNKRENALQSTNMSTRLGRTVPIKENKESQIRFCLQVYLWFISLCEM